MTTVLHDTQNDSCKKVVLVKNTIVVKNILKIRLKYVLLHILNITCTNYIFYRTITILAYRLYRIMLIIITINNIDLGTSGIIFKRFKNNILL